MINICTRARTCTSASPSHAVENSVIYTSTANDAEISIIIYVYMYMHTYIV